MNCSKTKYLGGLCLQTSHSARSRSAQQTDALQTPTLVLIGDGIIYCLLRLSLPAVYRGTFCQDVLSHSDLLPEEVSEVIYEELLLQVKTHFRTVYICRNPEPIR